MRAEQHQIIEHLQLAAVMTATSSLTRLLSLTAPPTVLALTGWNRVQVVMRQPSLSWVSMMRRQKTASNAVREGSHLNSKSPSLYTSRRHYRSRLIKTKSLSLQTKSFHLCIRTLWNLVALWTVLLTISKPTLSKKVNHQGSSPDLMSRVFSSV